MQVSYVPNPAEPRCQTAAATLGKRLIRKSKAKLLVTLGDFMPASFFPLTVWFCTKLRHSLSLYGQDTDLSFRNLYTAALPIQAFCFFVLCYALTIRPKLIDHLYKNFSTPSTSCRQATTPSPFNKTACCTLPATATA